MTRRPPFGGGRVTPHDWLSMLYADAPPSAWLTVSLKRDAATRSAQNDPFRTEWFAAWDLEVAANAIVGKANSHNIYFGLGLRRCRLATDQRGCARDVVCIPGLWVEVDVAGGAHGDARKVYFPSKESALELLRAGLPVAPTAVVDSGGGLHAYWLFREPWVFSDQDDNDHAAAVMRGWQGFIRRQTSYAIDSTHDLARVLRVPGTSNRKNGSVQPVRALFADGPRYSPSDFDDWLESESETIAIPHGVKLREAEPPALKLSAMLEDRKFKATWLEQRRDLKDTSRSGYCMSLASQCLMAGWADQEVIDLLVSWMKPRLRVGEKPKALGWYALTVGKARSPRVDASAEKAIQVERAASATEPEERLAALSALLGFKVHRIVRRIAVDESGITGEPFFVIETELGSLEMSTERMRSKLMFLNDVYGKLGRNVEIPTKLWPQVSQAIADSWVTEDAPEESTVYSEMRQALKEYGDRRTATDDPIQAYDSNQVLERDGMRWAPFSRFCDWARMRKSIHIGPRNVTRLLMLAGSQRMKIDNLTRAGRRTSLTFWSVP